MIVSAAIRTPTAVGLNLTLARQLAPAARLAPQLLLAMLKSPRFGPVSAMLVIPSVVGPALASVTV